MSENEARDILRELGYLVDVLWSKDDIRQQASNNDIKLTEDDVNEIAERIQHRFDADLGINWDNIHYHILEVKNKL